MSLRGIVLTVATTGQRCFTLSQRNGVWLNSTSDSSSAARFVLAPTTNPNLLRQTGGESEEQQLPTQIQPRGCSESHICKDELKRRWNDYR